MGYRNALLIAAFAGLLCFSGATYVSIQSITSLDDILGYEKNLQVTDRNGIPLSVSYQGRWNVSDYKPLYVVPEELKQLFILSEDKNFYAHRGVDWNARGAALWQNIRARRVVRGASTITEQVVRMVHPRPRSLWSKWIEGFEASQLERHVAKADIFEFYLNQLPYSANRRGISQAADYYFNRDLSTLTFKEMAALTVLARAPSSYDLYRNTELVEKGISSLLEKTDHTAKEKEAIRTEMLVLAKPSLSIDASHFVRFARKQAPHSILHTTLDAPLQTTLQSTLDKRLETLRKKHARNGAVLVVDHHTNTIVAWVNGGALSGSTNDPTPGWAIDAVTTPRQPGSSLKPFLYAAALDKGWTAATMIDDSPLSEAIGTGLHSFRNYSRQFYGSLSLRETLGNSLNIPALKTIRFVGAGSYLTLLNDAGFSTLDRSSAIYDEGLALGNAEVTLYDLVQGYTVFARRGQFTPLRLLQQDKRSLSAKRIFSDESASLIGNILSDPYARRFEFGTNSVLNFPVQTAVKTGTSNDYHDAWAIGYNDKYVVGVWIGNLGRTPMDGITGSTGAALVLRSTFAELNKNRETKPLYLSPTLQQRQICTTPHQACYARTEYFSPGTEPEKRTALVADTGYEMVRPTDHLQIAFDPRIPVHNQRFRFEISRLNKNEKVEWILNGKKIALTDEREYLWPLERGKYTLSAIIHGSDHTTSLSEVSFLVK